MHFVSFEAQDFAFSVNMNSPFVWSADNFFALVNSLNLRMQQGSNFLTMDQVFQLPEPLPMELEIGGF